MVKTKNVGKQESIVRSVLGSILVVKKKSAPTLTGSGYTILESPHSRTILIDTLSRKE